MPRSTSAEHRYRRQKFALSVMDRLISASLPWTGSAECVHDEATGYTVLIAGPDAPLSQLVSMLHDSREAKS